MANDHNIFIPPAVAAPAGNSESPADPSFRWHGQPVNGEKTAEAGVRARRSQFKSVEEFAAWRRSKNFPELSQAELEAAFDRFRGITPGEKAVMNPILERR